MDIASPSETRGTAEVPPGGTAGSLTADKAAAIIAVVCLVFIATGRRIFKGAVI